MWLMYALVVWQVTLSKSWKMHVTCERGQNNTMPFFKWRPRHKSRRYRHEGRSRWTATVRYDIIGIHLFFIMRCCMGGEPEPFLTCNSFLFVDGNALVHFNRTNLLLLQYWTLLYTMFCFLLSLVSFICFSLQIWFRDFVWETAVYQTS